MIQTQAKVGNVARAYEKGRLCTPADTKGRREKTGEEDKRTREKKTKEDERKRHKKREKKTSEKETGAFLKYKI